MAIFPALQKLTHIYSLHEYLMCYNVEEVGEEGTNLVTRYLMH